MITAEQVERFRRLCGEAREIVITTHINPDGDAIGSECALAAFIRSTGRRPRVINRDPTPGFLRHLEEPETAAETYRPEAHDALLRAADLVILVDNSAPDRLGEMEPLLREVAGKTFCIDHHPTRGAGWAHHIVDEGSCATTAIIYELTRESGWRPDARAAEALYVGLVTDTGFFRFNSTNAVAHTIAADLLGLGVDPARVYKRIHERNTVAFTRLLGHALAGLRMDADGAIASVTIPRSLLEELGATGEDPAEITTPLLAMEGVQVAALYRELADGRIKVSLRSKGRLDVHRLAGEFGGGGHRNASGIVMDGSLDRVVETVSRRCAALLASAEDTAGN